MIAVICLLWMKNACAFGLSKTQKMAMCFIRLVSNYYGFSRAETPYIVVVISLIIMVHFVERAI